MNSRLINALKIVLEDAKILKEKARDKWSGSEDFVERDNYEAEYLLYQEAVDYLELRIDQVSN